MSDIADQATDLIDREANAIFARHAARTHGPAPVWINGAPTCADCGDDLPAARAQAGRGRCIACQERHERREALRA